MTTFTPNLTTTQLQDLAAVLVEGRVAAIAYIDLGWLVACAEADDIDPRAVEIARARLEAARDRGNSTAASILAQLDKADES